MAWYCAGTVTVNQNSTVVVGADTAWTKQAKAGDIFTIDRDKFYMVADVTSDVGLTIWPAYTGASARDQSYSIIRNFTSTTNADLASRMADLVARWKRREDEMIAWLSGTVSGGPNGDGAYPLTDLQGNVKMVRCPAWVTAILGDATHGNMTLGLLDYTAGRPRVHTATLGAAHTIALTEGEMQTLTLTADTALTLPTPPAGRGLSVLLVLIQDGTGGRTPALQTADGAPVRWLGGTAPSWQTAAGALDVVAVTHTGTVSFAAHIGGGA
ncbi:hypothetical protein F1188_16380 [Roseospira marina]|uniref:Uncharacterized protein n=1 Tax=Roseospira marina TaxID=140057 RepID=A0A5M6I825_9PROT|nr:hypothetical protein [Roseospira marina]KAA5604434.1 hypothetical protein F1188_16380 [Roseospira marina]MBB4315368.1 hypothetical protein [Roseospira marina]MBB5088487.1 hypothetical protein [Roseospira marina]